MSRRLYIMDLLRTLLFGAVVVACVYSNALPLGDNEENHCPPPQNLAPCTCVRGFGQRVAARCANLTDADEIKSIFDRNRDWEVYEINIEECVMEFIPAKILEEVHFHTLNVTSTSLVTLFDTTPVTTSELFLLLQDVRLLRGFEWRSIANSNLNYLVISNMNIKSFGQEFKDNIPKGVQKLRFENTGTTSIKNRAFSDLVKLDDLILTKGSLKKVSRDMFPRPWIVNRLDLSYHKIAALPEDFFVDMPKIYDFEFTGNLLTTISEKVFIIHDLYYGLYGNPIVCDCDIKWVFGTLRRDGLNADCAEPESFKGKYLGDLTADDFSYCH